MIVKEIYLLLLIYRNLDYIFKQSYITIPAKFLNLVNSGIPQGISEAYSAHS